MMANIVSALEILALVTVVLIISALALFLGLCVYFYFQHEAYEHIPGPPRASFFLGNIPQIQNFRSKGQFFDQMLRNWSYDYGKTFVIWLGHRPVICVIDPKDIKKVISTYNLPKEWAAYKHMGFLFGQRLTGYGLVSNVIHSEWQKRRLAMNPAFHRKSLKDMMPVYNEKCNDFLKAMDKFSESKEVFSMAEMCQRVTMDVIAKAIFSMDFNSVLDLHHPFPKAVSVCMTGIQESFKQPYSKYIVSTWSYQNQVVREVKFLRNFCRKQISDRMQAMSKGETVPTDILTVYMKNIQSTDLNLEDFIDDILTLFVAGHETTGNTLAFMMFEVAANPEIAQRIVDEVDEVLGSRQHVDYEDIGKLEYTTQVLKETLRRHLVAPGTIRFSNKSVEIGGWRIPSGTGVRLCFSAMQLHSDYYEDPEVFNPDRFSTDGNKTESLSYNFLPFSAGTRNCIGQFLAQFEAKLIMARFLQNFRLNLEPGQTSAVLERLTSYPRDGVMGKVCHRL